MNLRIFVFLIVVHCLATAALRPDCVNEDWVQCRDKLIYAIFNGSLPEKNVPGGHYLDICNFD
jgi:hypothetical protein